MKIIIFFIYTLLSNARFSRPITLIFVLDNRITLFEFGIIQVGYFLSRLLSEIPSGVYADTIKRKYSLAFGSLLAAVSAYCLFGYNLQNSFWLILFLFCLDGIGSSFQSGSDQAMLYDYLKNTGRTEKYVKYLGWNGAISSIVLGVTTAIGGVLAVNSITLPFLLQGIALTLSALLIMFFPEKNTVTSQAKNKETPIYIAKQGFKTVKQFPIIQFLILFLTVLAASTNAITMYMQGYFSELKLSSDAIGYIFGIGTFLSAIVLLNSVYLAKMTLRSILLLTTTMFFVGISLLLTGNIVLVILGFYLVYLKLDVLEPSLFNIVNEFVPEKVRATVLSTFGLSLNVVSMVMYPLFGLAGDFLGYQGILSIMGVLCLPLFVYLYVFYKKYDIKQIKAM
ncbi:MFS transporter [Priestia megaterium]|uniref:MFS transporter n=1 Tax=Priestia megaterium TaxID=1404 RepID=UPI0018A045E4|nr:MFS transporter [Priestia megaterium]